MQWLTINFFVTLLDCVFRICEPLGKRCKDDLTPLNIIFKGGRNRVKRVSRLIQRQRQVKDMDNVRKDEFRKLIEILKRLGFSSEEIVEILLIIES